MNQSTFVGQTGLVTGACGPVGRALVSRLLASGARVLVMDRDTQECAGSSELADQLSLDLTADGACDEVAKFVERQTDKLDFLVNNAALTASGGTTSFSAMFERQTDEDFDSALLLNLAVPYRLVRRLIPLLRSAAHPTVVNVASIYGIVGPQLSLYEGTSMGSPAGYFASKGGLIQLTRYLASVLAPHIRVNCVAPGGILRDQDPNFVTRYVERTPLRRMAKEEDVVGAICWLLGGDSGFVTGQVIAVDGGWTAI